MPYKRSSPTKSISSSSSSSSKKKSKRRISDDPDCSITSITSTSTTAHSPNIRSPGSATQKKKGKKNDDLSMLPVELYGCAQQELEKNKILQENEFERGIIISYRREKKAVRSACWKYGYVQEVKLPPEWLTARKANGKSIFFYSIYNLFIL